MTITNTGTLPATFSLTEVASTNGFTDSNLKARHQEHDDECDRLRRHLRGLEDGKKTDLGEVAAKAANTYVFTVTLDKDTPNDDQGKTASATYQWARSRLAATSTDQ